MALENEVRKYAKEAIKIDDDATAYLGLPCESLDDLIKLRSENEDVHFDSKEDSPTYCHIFNRKEREVPFFPMIKGTCTNQSVATNCVHILKLHTRIVTKIVKEPEFTEDTGQDWLYSGSNLLDMEPVAKKYATDVIEIDDHATAYLGIAYEDLDDLMKSKCESEDSEIVSQEEPSVYCHVFNRKERNISFQATIKGVTLASSALKIKGAHVFELHTHIVNKVAKKPELSSADLD